MHVYRDMARERNPKKPDHRYFDSNLVCELDALGQPYEQFISDYAQYVFFRARNFRQK